MKTERVKVKVRPLAPAEARVLELARNAIKPMCDLFRMVPQEDWSPATLGIDGEMRKRFFKAEVALETLDASIPKTSTELPKKSLFPENERMHLGERGYSKEDIEKIRAITSRLVEGRVLKGEVDPANDGELKAAIKQAGHDALQAYNAALEYLAG